MTELKTLKDFREANKEGLFSEHKVREEIFDLLKQESIKWVKELEKYPRENIPGIFNMGSEVSKFIKHFFNLSQFDIKDTQASEEVKNG